MRRGILTVLIIYMGMSLQAADLIEALPLTDQVVMLHFSDGTLDYPGYGQERNEYKINSHPIDTIKVKNLNNYLVKSTDDKDFIQAVHPVKIGRKSKPTDVANGWPPIQPVIMDHWVYLVLPKKMKRGNHYTITIPGIAKNKDQVEIVFDEFKSRSEAIHVNQVGYPRQHMKKVAYVSHWMGDLGGLELESYFHKLFYVYDLERNEPVWVGKMRKRKDFETGVPETKHLDETPLGNFSACDVWECDFSECKSQGEFVIVVEGIGHSFPFKINDDVYREAFYTTCRGLYHERAGIELKEPYTKWTRGAGHNGFLGQPMVYTKFRFMDSKSEGANKKKVDELVTGEYKTFGWYHDAGDWDGYPTHMVVPSYLMTVFEMAPENFSDEELNIPESGNGIPDILDEAAWLLNYFRRTKGPTGGIAGGRVHADYFKKPSGVGSAEDDRTWYVFGEEPLISFRYAGQAAQYAYCMDMIGQKDSAKTWLEEAVNAYEWALENTLEGDQIENARMFSSAWLFKYTGKQEYLDQFKKDNPFTSTTDKRPSLNRHWSSWAVWAYATTKMENMDMGLKKQMKNLAIHWADTINVGPANVRAHRMGFDYGFPMLIGQATTPWVMESVIAYELTGDKKYLECVLTTADYMLGGNPLNMCWVTGLGDRYPQQLLHLDSWYDDIDAMVPGLVPYGPHRGGNRGGRGFNGPWDADLARAIVYPDEVYWPGHEMYFENRYCPITNEFTIHQNIAPAAAIYGYLCGKKK